MPEPGCGSAGARHVSRDVAGAALGMSCGRFVDIVQSEFAAHKRHDSATWVTRTNAKTYTARRDVELFAELLADLLPAPLVDSLADPLAASPTSLAKTRTASLSWSAGVLP
ncbi:hypothetical protein LMG28690_06206 [Paraburkholderia caffeinilytica]|nr:hypothetical protein LMG28690_06206 [Paraburkholderia caffeinilytica]